jgi:hypothetical protein
MSSIFNAPRLRAFINQFFLAHLSLPLLLLSVGICLCVMNFTVQRHAFVDTLWRCAMMMAGGSLMNALRPYTHI